MLIAPSRGAGRVLSLAPSSYGLAYKLQMKTCIRFSLTALVGILSVLSCHAILLTRGYVRLTTSFEMRSSNGRYLFPRPTWIFVNNPRGCCSYDAYPQHFEQDRTVHGNGVTDYLDRSMSISATRAFRVIVPGICSSQVQSSRVWSGSRVLPRACPSHLLPYPQLSRDSFMLARMR